LLGRQPVAHSYAETLGDKVKLITAPCLLSPAASVGARVPHRRQVGDAEETIYLI
jgi:hypothetical protein